MQTGALKTTVWYKCLVCHTFFQSPKALVVHRMKSQCRFKYKEIHKERSKWSFETPLLDNLEEEEEASRLKDSQQLLKSTKTIDKAQAPTEQFSNKSQASVQELSEKSRNSELKQVTSCNIDPPNPLPKNQITNFEDLKNQTREESDEIKSGSLNFDNNRMRSDEVKLNNQSSTSNEFICNLCQKSFSQLCTLRAHISNVHERLSLNSCKQCLKTFTRKHNLKLHVSAVHQRLKAYCCKECPKTFGHPTNLRNHVSMIHERLLPNYCKQCPKTFSTKKNLNLHISTVHQGLKPYSCKECPKTFVQPWILRSHVSMIHKKLLS